MTTQEPSRSQSLGKEKVEYESIPERKSYLHRQRPGDIAQEKTPNGMNITPTSRTTPASASPDTPDVSDSRTGLRRAGSSSSQQSSKRRQKRLSPATSLTQANSQTLANVSASPSLDRVASIDRVKDTMPSSISRSSSINRPGRSNVMNTQDSVKMQGQDTLEVRNVTLPDGQSASLVLEDGKLQRIVSSSGNIVEVHWQGGRIRRQEKGGPDRQLAVKLRSTTHFPQESETSQTSKISGFKSLANTLVSQRLSSQKLNTSLVSREIQPGLYTKSDKDIRTIKSLDFSARNKAQRRQRALTSQGYPSAIPETTGRTASHNDMSTIAENSRPTEWNPMSSTWLPPTMTSKEGAQQAPMTGLQKEKLQTGNQSEFQTPRFGESGASTPVHLPVQTPESQFQTKKSPKKQEKKKLWQTIRDFFRISKKKSPAKEGPARALSFSEESRRGGMEDRQGAQTLRASAPAAPSASSSLNVQGSSLPSHEYVREAEEDPELRMQDRATVSNQALTDRISQPMGTRPVLQEGTTKSASPIMPISSDIISRQYRFGPENGSLTSENLQNKANVSSRSSPMVGQVVKATGRSLKKDLIEPLPGSKSTIQRDANLVSRGRGGSRELAPKIDIVPKQRMSLAGFWQRNFTEGTSGAKVDELLNVSSLQRLAREKTMEMQIMETDEVVELRWHIPLNGSTSKISKVDRYLKNGEVVEGARRDGRAGVLRSQLTFTPEGHVHIRALQGAPYSAVFHDRLKLSSGGRRIKLEQKFQLLEPGVAPVKHYSIWNRIE